MSSRLATIDDFLAKVDGQSEKAAEAYTEPGSQGGATEHPVKNVDDRTEVAQEGSRSSENSSDVKEDQGEPAVDNTPEAKPGSDQQDGVQVNIGTEQAATGEQPSVETSSTEAGKEDPGSSHPARTDNDSLDGHKYSSDMSLEDIAVHLKKLGEDICSEWAAEAVGQEPQPKQAENEKQKPAQEPEKAAGKQSQNSQEITETDKLGWQIATKYAEFNGVDPESAAAAGWELAGLLTGNFDKRAADSMVQHAVEETIFQAHEDAEKVAKYLEGFFKGAEEGEEGGESPEEGGETSSAPPESEGREVPAGPPAEGGEGDLLAALGGGGAPEAPPEMGGEMGGEEGDLEALAALLQELNLNPEELIALLGEEGGGEPEAPAAPPMGPEGDMGGGGPEGGMVPPEAMGAPMEVSASDKKSEKKAQMMQMLRELAGRSRR